MRKVSLTKLNIGVSLFHQFFTAICRLVIARLILHSFGSENNGLMQSVDQILAYTVLLEGGIVGVMRATLYKPLVDGDMETVSDIFHSGRRMFRKISEIFMLFVLLLAGGMKLIVQTEFDWLYVSSMVFILGLNTLFNYYFALSQRLLITADQKLFLIQIFQIISTVLTLLVCLVAIHFGAGIHIVKALTAVVSLVCPIFCCIYVKTHYSISRKPRKRSDPIPQKRDAVIHHLAYFVHRNTDILILSLFSSLVNVSIYSVYHSIISVLEQIMTSISSGIASLIGNLLARKEFKRLMEIFNLYEACNMMLSFSLAVVCAILILPFISIYTSGVADANYQQPLFAILVICGNLVHCLLLPYNITISAAGHYKQTKVGAIGEVGINLTVSLLLVVPLGLVGVAIGTLAAMTFRLLYSIHYLSQNLLERSKHRFIRGVLPNLLLATAIIWVFTMLGGVPVDGIVSFLISGVIVSVIVFPLFILLNWLLEPKLFQFLIKKRR